MFVGFHTLFLKIVFTSDTIWTFSITWYFKVYTIYVVTLLNECNFNKKSSESEGIFQMLLRMADQKQMRPISNIQIKTVKWFAHNCISYLQFQFPVFNFYRSCQLTPPLPHSIKRLRLQSEGFLEMFNKQKLYTKPSVRAENIYG